MKQVALPGGPPVHIQAGDFFLTYSKSWLGWIIRFGQRLHRDERRYAWTSHAGLIVSDNGTIIEALSSGLAVGNLSQYQGQKYVVVRPPFGTVQRAQAVAWAKAEYQRHPKYGWTDAVSVALQMITPTKFDLNWNGSMICSGYVARFLEHGGYGLATTSPFITSPSDLAAMFDVPEP